MNQTNISGKCSFASLLHSKRREKAKIDQQRVDLSRQMKRKQHIKDGTPKMYPASLVQLGYRPHIHA